MVHLDLDSLILQPLDDLFDVMMNKTISIESQDKIPSMFDKPMSEQINAFYTRDYNMVHLGHRHPGVQGGFLVIRPSMSDFNTLKDIILEGDFRQFAGWKGTVQLHHLSSLHVIISFSCLN